MRLSIPTHYAGTLFRSKLEADWARTLDALGIPWEYEKAGHQFGEVFYLPDFWLPKAGQFIEVKGVFADADFRKVNALCSDADRKPWRFRPRKAPDIVLIAACPDGWFHGWPRTTAPDVEATDLGLDLGIYRCQRCSGLWFAESLTNDERCRCCGYEPRWPDRNPQIHNGFVDPWPMHPRKAA